MLNKTIEKEKRKTRETWIGYYPRRTKTFEERKRAADRKYKSKYIEY